VRPFGVTVAFTHTVHDGDDIVWIPVLVTVFLFVGVIVVASDIVTVRVLAGFGVSVVICSCLDG